MAPPRIRFYERIDLLRAVARRPNGYRTYPPEAVVVLDPIATARNAGFSLDEIAALLPTDLDRWEHGARLDGLRKMREIEALQALAAQSRAKLVALVADIDAKPDDITWAANARRVPSRLLRSETGRRWSPLAAGRWARPALGRGEASPLRRQSKAATFSAVALADHGFCPVTRRPSATA